MHEKNRKLNLRPTKNAVLLNPARLGGSTRWLDQSGCNKRSAGATTRPKPGRPIGSPHDPGEPGRDPIFFFFLNVGFETH